MNKFVVLLLIIAVLLGACSSNQEHVREAVVANVMVIDKGSSDDGHYWIMAAYPGKEKMKSVVQLPIEKNIWSTIGINRKYTVHYAEQDDGTYQLYDITPLKD